MKVMLNPHISPHSSDNSDSGNSDRDNSDSANSDRTIATATTRLICRYVQARTQGFEKGGYIVEKISIEYLAFNVKLFFNMQE